MLPALSTRSAHYAVLIGVAALMFLVNLGGPSLWDVDEGRNAASSVEMMESGDWIKPTFNGLLRDHKPALLYWLQVLAYHWFGVNEFAARLPSALAAILTVLLTYELARRLFDAATGLTSGLVVATTILLGAAGRFANPDALLNLFLVLTFVLFWDGWSRKGKYPFFACGAACGLAVLAKGPVGLVLPTAVLVLFLLWERKLKALVTPRFLLGIISFSVIALPWYILVCAETKGEFLEGFFFRHNVDRFLSPMEHHSGGFSYYLMVILVGCAPWSAFLGLAVWYGLWSALSAPWTRCQGWWLACRDMEATGSGSVPSDGDAGAVTDHASRAAAYRLLWCWLLVFLVFFTAAATKLPNYILPITTPLAILTGRLLERWRGGLRIVPWAWGTCLASFGVVGMIAALGVFVGSGGIAIRGVHLQPFAGSEFWALFGALPLAGAALAWWYWGRGQRRMGLCGLQLTAILFVGPLLAWAAATFDQYKPPRLLVAQTATLDRTREIKIVSYKTPHLASLHFYCQRGVTYCHHDEEAINHLRRQTPVFLFVPAATWEQLRHKVNVPCRVLASHPDMHKSVGEVVVVTNEMP